MTKSKQLLINCDDIGMHAAVNTAAVRLFQSSGIHSFSVLATGQAFDNAVIQFKEAGIKYVGAHLSLTSEYPLLPQKPVTPLAKIPSLLNDKQTFYPTVEDMARHATVSEVELEWRNQIERILKAGFKLSHLDGHMFCYEACEVGHSDFLKIVEKLAKEYTVPYRERDRKTSHHPHNTIQIWEGYDGPFEREMYYHQFVEGNFKDNWIEMIVHPSLDHLEFTSVIDNADRRVRDYLFFSHPETVKKLRSNLEMVAWSTERSISL